MSLQCSKGFMTLKTVSFPHFIRSVLQRKCIFYYNAFLTYEYMSTVVMFLQFVNIFANPIKNICYFWTVLTNICSIYLSPMLENMWVNADVVYSEKTFYIYSVLFVVSFSWLNCWRFEPKFKVDKPMYSFA